jgi:hypothetical protein
MADRTARAIANAAATRAPQAQTVQADSAPTLLRYAYCSRAVGGVDAQREALNAFGPAVRAHNPQQGITGALLGFNGYYLHVVEGLAPAVDALIARIDADSRHSDIVVLERALVTRRTFRGNDIAWVERTEREADTRARIARLHETLRNDPDVQVVDYFRWMLAPRVSGGLGAQPASTSRSQALVRVVVAGASPLWGAAALQHVAHEAATRVGRTVLHLIGDDAQRHLIEYVDVGLADGTPLRLVSTSAHSLANPAADGLISPISTVVLIATASELDDCVRQVQPYLKRLGARPHPPDVIIVSSVRADRLDATAATLAAACALRVRTQQVKLSDVSKVWQVVQHAIDGKTRVAVPKPPEPPEPQQVTLLDAPAAAPLFALDGFEECALMLLAPACVVASAHRDGGQARGLEQELHTLCLQDALCQQLDGGLIEDVIVQTTKSLQLFRPLPGQPHLYLAIQLDRSRANAATARLALQSVAAALDTEALLPTSPR